MIWILKEKNKNKKTINGGIEIINGFMRTDLGRNKKYKDLKKNLLLLFQ